MPLDIGNDKPTISRLTTVEPALLAPLLAASQREGFRFVTRFCTEWADGTNRFDRPGEALFGVFTGPQLTGIGGLNRQSGKTGRLRRFYILPSHRRQGLGRLLLDRILTHAFTHFRRVVLRTDTEAADRFYRACGFRRIEDLPGATHGMELG